MGLKCWHFWGGGKDYSRRRSRERSDDSWRRGLVDYGHGRNGAMRVHTRISRVIPGVSRAHVRQLIRSVRMPSSDDQLFLGSHLSGPTRQQKRGFRVPFLSLSFSSSSLSLVPCIFLAPLFIAFIKHGPGTAAPVARLDGRSSIEVPSLMADGRVNLGFFLPSFQG